MGITGGFSTASWGGDTDFLEALDKPFVVSIFYIIAVTAITCYSNRKTCEKSVAFCQR
jgi:hypothetical protein